MLALERSRMVLEKKSKPSDNLELDQVQPFTPIVFWSISTTYRTIFELVGYDLFSHN